MSQCKVCKKKTLTHFMNNKPLCLRCDVLLIDLEIECEEERQEQAKRQIKTGTGTAKETVRFN